MPNNILRPFLIVFVNLILLGMVCGQTPDLATKGDSIAGDWIVRFSVENQTVPGKMNLKVEGESVTGTIETGHTGPGTFQDGKCIDGKLTATLVFEKHESIALTGGFQADNNQKLEGEFRTEGHTGKWEAERASDKVPTAGTTPYPNTVIRSQGLGAGLARHALPSRYLHGFKLGEASLVASCLAASCAIILILIAPPPG